MSDTILRAVYDANLLYDAHLRDLCIWLGIVGAVEPRWTNTIHEEWTRNLRTNRPDVPVERIERLRRLIDASIPDCLVTAYEPLIAKITLPDLDDRHVVAAAMQCEADLIVTFNERDFPNSILDGYNLKAVSPDTFIAQLLTLIPDLVCQAVMKHHANLSRPPVTMESYLNTLRTRGLPNAAKLLPEICTGL